MLNLINTLTALEPALPPVLAPVEYVVAANGLFIRAADSRMEALVPVAPAHLYGLAEVEPYARLKVERIPAVWLEAVLKSARKHMPNEVLYQFRVYEGKWTCVRPQQAITSVSVKFDDSPDSVVDLHSHNSMAAFFSDTDDGDEQGLRFYVVIGRLDTDAPEIACRVGVYGHHWPVPATSLFETAGPFADTFSAGEPPAWVPQSLSDDEDLLDAFAEALGVEPSAINPNALIEYVKELARRKNETKA